MTENMIIEAVRAAGLQSQQAFGGMGVAAPDPAAVAQFQSAMAAPGTSKVMDVPFAEAVSKTWTRAHENNQAIIHRIRALSELKNEHMISAPEFMELQYEVANLAFQQEVVAKVADKASNAIQTLIKNQ